MSAENSDLVPAFVVLQIGTRRVALPRAGVAELIASSVVYKFPHTTRLITGVVLRRNRILPVLDLGPNVLGVSSPDTRFFLVVERNIFEPPEKCAIPVQGACELVSGIMLPEADPSGFVIGYLDLNGEQIEIVDLERAIASNTINMSGHMPATEALS